MRSHEDTDRVEIGLSGNTDTFSKSCVQCVSVHTRIRRNERDITSINETITDIFKRLDAMKAMFIGILSSTLVTALGAIISTVVIIARG